MEYRRVAIIGTAGRDKTKPLSVRHWNFMCEKALTIVQPNDILVSGGAAWADHVAVRLYNTGRVLGLELHLPAPFNRDLLRFGGEHGSCGATTNFYHSRFSSALRRDTLLEINTALATCTYTEQPVGKGFGAFFARNNLVAESADEVIAFTFGVGDQVADGGTKHTFDRCKGVKHHFSLLEVR